MGTPFISRTDLSDYIGRDVSTDDGALIAVDAACEMVRTLSEQQLDEATETITLDGTGTETLNLPQLPVNAAGTVVVDGGTITDYVLGNNGMLFRGTAGIRSYAFDYFPAYPSWGWGGWGAPVGPYVWPAGRQNVQVTYDHGYTSVPEDLRMVALSIATRLVIQGPASSETMGQNQIAYAVNSTDLTGGEKMIIQKYRRHY